jgi:hypothetical protein
MPDRSESASRQGGDPLMATEHRPPAPSPAAHNRAFSQPTASQDYASGSAIRDGINSTSHGIR